MGRGMHIGATKDTRARAAPRPNHLRATALGLAVIASALWSGGCRTAPQTPTADAPRPAAVLVPPAAPPTPPWIAPALAAAITEPLDDPAMLCPASAVGYLRVDRLAQWRASGESDPLVKYVWQTVQALGPPSCWQRAAKHLGWDNDAMLDAYFGRTVALIGQRVDGQPALVVASRIGAEALRKLPAAAGLKPWAPPGAGAGPESGVRRPESARSRGAGLVSVGPFAMYSTEEDGEAFVFAIGKRWLLIVEQKRIEHLRRVLTVTPRRGAGGGENHADDTVNPPLAELPAYRQLLAKLPTGRSALLSTGNSKGTERHAAAVVRHGRDLTVHYVATGTKLARIDRRAAHSAGVDFGLLPAATVSAATINMLDRSPRQFGLLDLLLFPHKIGAQILPKLSPPMIVFLGTVPGAEVRPDPGGAVPVVGAAVKLNDYTAARDLDRLVAGLHLVANLRELDLIRSVFGLRRVKAGDTTFHVADFGEALSKRLKDPQLSPLLRLPSSAGLTRLSFGRIGQWYVLCSQEAFFRRCIAADADGAKRLTHTNAFGAFAFESRPQLIASAMTRADELSTLVKNTADFYSHAHTEAPGNSATTRSLPDLGAPLRWFAEALQYHQSFYFQLWQDRDDTLCGKLQIVAQQHAGSAPF